MWGEGDFFPFGILGGVIVDELGHLIGDIVIVCGVSEFEFGEVTACLADFLVFVDSVEGVFDGLFGGLQEDPCCVEVKPIGGGHDAVFQRTKEVCSLVNESSDCHFRCKNGFGIFCQDIQARDSELFKEAEGMGEWLILVVCHGDSLSVTTWLIFCEVV